jgi:hypothetical protein
MTGDADPDDRPEASGETPPPKGSDADDADPTKADPKAAMGRFGSEDQSDEGGDSDTT